MSCWYVGKFVLEFLDLYQVYVVLLPDVDENRAIRLQERGFISAMKDDLVRLET